VPSQEWPAWWDWEIELTPHVEKRMVDRGFTELELRAMLERANRFRQEPFCDRFIIETRHRGERWEVIVEPDPREPSLVVVTAYCVEAR
jgi:hypothetical protein